MTTPINDNPSSGESAAQGIVIPDRMRDVVRGDDLLTGDPAELIRDVELPDGRRVFIRILSLAEMERFERAFTAAGRTDLRSRLIMVACCDPVGGPLFPAGPTTLATVGRIPSAVAILISDAIMKINSLTAEATEPVKNDSGTTGANGSSSD